MNDKKEIETQLTISIILRSTIVDLYRIQQYSVVVNEQIVEKIPQIWNSLFHISNQNHPKELKEIFEMANNLAVDETGYKLPLIIWYSIFTYCYHLLETKLNHICKILFEQRKYKVKINDLVSRGGSGLFRAKDYLIKIANINFPDSSKEWNDIVLYSKIRNIIVHNSGYVDKKNTDKNILHFINGKENITINDRSSISFDLNFILEIIDNYIGLLTILKDNFCPDSTEEELYNRFINAKEVNKTS